MHHKSNAAFLPEQVEYRLLSPYIQVKVPIAAQRFRQICGHAARGSIDTENSHLPFMKKADGGASDQTGCTSYDGGCPHPGSSCR